MYEISTSKYLYLHIVLSIYFTAYNLMMATWGPKHVVVNSIPAMLSNYTFSYVYDCCSHLFLHCSLYTTGMSHLKIVRNNLSTKHDFSFPPKFCYISTKLHGITSQKTVMTFLFTLNYRKETNVQSCKWHYLSHDTAGDVGNITELNGVILKTFTVINMIQLITTAYSINSGWGHKMILIEPKTV